MDDLTASAADVYVEVGVTVYSASANELRDGLISIPDIFENASIELPDNLSDYLSTTDVIDRLVTEGTGPADSDEFKSVLEQLSLR